MVGVFLRVSLGCRGESLALGFDNEIVSAQVHDRRRQPHLHIHT
jgi:hypothetical protein